MKIRLNACCGISEEWHSVQSQLKIGTFFGYEMEISCKLSGGMDQKSAEYTFSVTNKNFFVDLK